MRWSMTHEGFPVDVCWTLRGTTIEVHANDEEIRLYEELNANAPPYYSSPEVIIAKFDISELTDGYKQSLSWRGFTSNGLTLVEGE